MYVEYMQICNILNVLNIINFDYLLIYWFIDTNWELGL